MSIERWDEIKQLNWKKIKLGINLKSYHDFWVEFFGGVCVWTLNPIPSPVFVCLLIKKSFLYSYSIEDYFYLESMILKSSKRPEKYYFIYAEARGSLFYL